MWEKLADPQYYWVFVLALFPLTATLCLGLNLFIRARGGRSFSLNIEGLGIKLKVESHASPERKQSDG